MKKLFQKGHVVSSEIRKKIGLANSIALKGRKLSQEHKLKIKKALAGKRCRPINYRPTEETKIKIRKTNKDIWSNKEQRMTSINCQKIAFKRIIDELPLLKEQGFEYLVPIGLPIPDIIGIKNGKVYAIEVEYGWKPNYSKYTEESKKYFDEVIWILRKK